MKKLVLGVFVLLLLLTPVVANAQNDFASWEDLIPYVESLDARIEELESQITPGVIQATWDGSDLVSTGENSNIIGPYEVGINKFEIKNGRYGDTLVIYFQFTNKSNETADFSDIGKTGFQNGIEIDSGYEFNENTSKGVRPGASLEVIYGFILTDKENPVELELHELFNFKNEPILYILDLSQASKE